MRSSTHSRGLLAIGIALTLVAAIPRFVELGTLSFYADEETSSMPARALLSGDGPRMPSGMAYHRALPLTWITAATAALVGPDNEIGYRLPVAVLGVLTVPLLLILGRSVVGTPAAVVATTLLAFSELHLVFSRQARMYAPLLLAFLAALALWWLWVEGGKAWHLLSAAALTVVAISLHLFGVLLAAFVLVPLAFPRWVRVPVWQLLAAAAAIAFLGWSYHSYVVEGPFRAMAPVPDALLPPLAASSTAGGILPFDIHPVTLLLATTGGALGAWCAALCRADDEPGAHLRIVVRFATAIGTGAFVGAGQLYGAAVAGLIFFVLCSEPRNELFRRARAPALALIAVAAGWLVFALWQHGLVEGIKSLLRFPFPYPALLTQQFPGIMLAFVAAAMWTVLKSPNAKDRGLRACVLVVVLLFAAVGAVSAWKGTRFFLVSYPFLLLATGVVLVALARLALRRWTRGEVAATVLAGAVACSGILGGHGLPQTVRVVTLRHGTPVNEWTHMFPFRPDHRGAGTFVREVRRPGDIVIAEDPLQQRWYAGPVDYWLRSMADASTFLYLAADNRLRDRYVDSQPLSGSAVRDSLEGYLDGRRAWLITSGETAQRRDYYLDPDQRQWLDSIESAERPAFVGADGITRVYCLNCPPEPTR